MKQFFSFVGVVAALFTILFGVDYFVAEPLNERIDELSSEIEALKSQSNEPRAPTIQVGIVEVQNEISELRSQIEALEQRVEELQTSVRVNRVVSPIPSVEKTQKNQSERSQSAEDDESLNMATLGKAFQSDSLRVTAINVVVGDAKRSIRVTTQFQNLTDEVLYLADHGLEQEVASTEVGDAFGRIELENIKRIASLRSDTYDMANNYTPLNAQSNIFVVWNIPMKSSSDRLRGKRLNLRSEILTLTDSGPERVPIQLEDIPLD